MPQKQDALHFYTDLKMNQVFTSHALCYVLAVHH